MKKTILAAFLFFMTIGSAFSTELPQNVIYKIKRDVPKATIRFDGLVEFPDGTQYLPVFPMDLTKTGTEAKIVQTFPANKTLCDEPPMVLFDNNFAMLKILKSQNHNPTVIFYNAMPLCVKRGLLPQDLLVPEDLVIPEELEILLGNLSIPTESLDDGFDYLKELDKAIEPKKAQQSQKANPLPSPQVFDKKIPSLARKMIYAINYQTNGVYLVNPETGKIVKVIPLRSTPSDMILTRNQRYLLLTTLGSSKLSVIDLTQRVVVKEFESGLLPNSIVVDKDKNIAYIANQNSSNISVIDLDNMEIKEKIEVTGAPCKLALTQNGKDLLYLDGNTDSVYAIVLSLDFRTPRLLFRTKNLSKMLTYGDKIYLASRDKDFVTVADAGSLKPIAQIPTGEKPVDMYIYNSKLYILNAESDSLSIVDLTNNIKIKDLALNTKGFPCKINQMDKNSKIIITTAKNHEYALVDLDQDKVEKKFPLEPVATVVIVSRRY